VNGMAGINTNGNDVTLTTTGGMLMIDAGAGQGITAAGMMADLEVAGAMEMGGSMINSQLLLVRGAGSMFSLGEANMVGTATTGAMLTFKDHFALTVDAVKGTKGVTTGNQKLMLMTDANFTVTDGGKGVNMIDTSSQTTDIMAGMGMTSGTLLVDVEGQINAT